MEGPVDTSDHDGRAGPGGSDHGDDPLDSAAAVADEKPGQSPESTADPEKTAAIVEACRWRDLSRLRDLAQSGGGLLSDDLRREAWPLLLGVQPREADSETDDAAGGDWKSLPRHRDEDQVRLDVDRSFVYYPEDQSAAELERTRSDLSRLICEVLRRHPYLCYFQGFHDICQVFLLLLGPASAASAVARLAVLRIRDFMLPTLAPTTSQLRLLPDLVARADPPLRRHIASIEPFYALAGTLTMYAHNIERYSDIARLFDALLAREPAFSIYLFAGIVIDRRLEILDIDEPDMLQVVLGRVPPRMDLDHLVARATDLYDRFPPDSLPSWRRLSAASAVKTARDPDLAARQTLDEGREFFEQQAKELLWLEKCDRLKRAVWAYRRPAKFVGAAVAAGLLAFYLRRNPTVVHHLTALLFSR